MKIEPLRIERTYNTSIDKVWKAITDKNEMKKWYFDLAEFKPEPGFEFSFVAGDDNKKFLHLCKVIDVIPGKKISYSWRYDGSPGESIVSWDLSEESDPATGSHVRLKLMHEGLESFPAIADFAKNNFEKGWTHILGISLREYLEKQ